METYEVQNGEGMYPESPTVFLTELGLKVMSSSTKFTVEGGRKGGKKGGREIVETCVYVSVLQVNISELGQNNRR